MKIDVPQNFAQHVHNRLYICDISDLPAEIQVSLKKSTPITHQYGDESVSVLTTYVHDIYGEQWRLEMAEADDAEGTVTIS